MGVDVSPFSRTVKDAAMSVIRKVALAWGGGAKEKEEESKVESTVVPSKIVSSEPARAFMESPRPGAESFPSAAGERMEAGHDEIPVEGLIDGIVRLARDGLGAVVKTGETAGSFVASEVRSELKAVAAEAAAEFKVLRRYIGRLLCGR